MGKKQDKESTLRKCVNYVNDWYKYYADHIERARNYLTFLYVDQWDANVRQNRELESRPTLEFNKLTSIVRGILGEQRNNSPQLTVRGLGKDATQEQVDIFDGLIRQIQCESDADIVYQVAGKHCLEVGWGAARVVSQYVSTDSFEQCLKILPIMDFQAAFWDPSAQETDKSDGDYCGVYTLMSMEHFKRIYPDVENPQEVSNEGGNYYLKWNSRDDILICEIYYKEYYTKNIAQLSDGNILPEDEANKIIKMQEDALAQVMNDDIDLIAFEPLEIVNVREVKDYKIKHLKIVANAILEETDYPGKILPVVYFEGDSTVIDGEQIPIPYIEDAVDTQKLINYVGSEIAYALLRSRKETIIGTDDNFKGHEKQWMNPDQVQGALIYNHDKEAGAPQFIKPPVFSPEFLQVYNNATQDLMQILGRFEESRGQETNAISGVAINARQHASNKPVNVYNDNLQRGIKQIGKIILDMIPHIYDTERTVMIRTPDNQTKAVDINKQNGFKPLPNGEIEERYANDVRSGKYDIEVRVDGSYDAQQAQAMDTLIRLASINPAISNLIPDLLAENSGLENTQQLVERLKTLVPPQIIAKEEGKELPPQSAQPDPAIMMQMQKNKILEDQNKLKATQQAIDQEKLMFQEKQLGLDTQVSLAKAQAEIEKAKIGKDVAILNHVNAIHAQ